MFEVKTLRECACEELEKLGDEINEVWSDAARAAAAAARKGRGRGGQPRVVTRALKRHMDVGSKPFKFDPKSPVPHAVQRDSWKISRYIAKTPGAAKQTAKNYTHSLSISKADRKRQASDRKKANRIFKTQPL